MAAGRSFDFVRTLSLSLSVELQPVHVRAEPPTAFEARSIRRIESQMRTEFVAAATSSSARGEGEAARGRTNEPITTRRQLRSSLNTRRPT